jgi:tRNA U34 5-carboxymethylaminomethyl modifying GTPase MnmE/TrmE
LLEQAAAGLRRGAEGVRARRPTELVAADVREAAQALAAIVGAEVGEEVLDEVFRRFCIGK